MRVFSWSAMDVPRPGWVPVGGALAAVGALVTAAVVTAAVVSVPAGASAAVAARAAELTETFGYVGATAQSTVVPDGASNVNVSVIGGMGGVTHGASVTVTGGDGADVTGTMAVTPGEHLRLLVAGRGGDGAGRTHPGDGGWGATGYGGRGGSGFNGAYDAAGGGGASAIEIGGTPAVIAGGGGGAGGRGFTARSDIGGQGGSSGATVDSGHKGYGPDAGRGGVGGVKVSGPGGGGDNGSYTGGGGGGGAAGYRGGGGGGGGGFFGGGGGGGGAGSSHYTAALESARMVRGVTADGNGLITLTWNNVAAPVCFDETVQVPRDSLGIAFRLHCTPASRPTGFQIVSGPQHGNLTDVNLTAGTFTYIPDRGFTGTDSLEYQAFTADRVSAVYTVLFLVREPTPMHLTASATRIELGGEFVLTVVMPPGATGHVGFYDLHHGELAGIGTASITDGVAVLDRPTRELGPGEHLIHASYGGDARYEPSDSNTVAVTVTGR
jgi:hypothetical protein